MELSRLATLIDANQPNPGIVETRCARLKLGRLVNPMGRTPVIYRPSLCVVASGRKVAYLGDTPFEYHSGNYLLCSLPLPIESEIIEASPERPILAAVYHFDPASLGKLLVEMDEFVDWPALPAGRPAVAPCRMTDRVHDALLRLIDAVSRPMDAKLVAPGLEKQLLLEVLRGPNGHLLRDFVLRDGHLHRVARVVTHLERNYRQPVDVNDLARRAGMSSSSLYEHFKLATSLSPLQFVKRMRLHEARALIVSGRGASEAAFEVGYSSPSQFSREFRRMFGCPPSKVAA